MTPTEWEITTLGLISKLREKQYLSEEAVVRIKNFVALAVDTWKNEELYE